MKSKKPPRRRWLRFSLRTFFIALTILCVWLSVVTTSARRQREAAEWVKEHQGDVIYDWQIDEASGEILNPPPLPSATDCCARGWETITFNRLST